MNRRLASLLSCVAAATLAVGCHDDAAQDAKHPHGSMDSVSMKAGSAKMMATKAVCQLTPAPDMMADAMGSKVKGTVKITEIADRVEYHIKLEGLAPGSVHGFHVHEKGDLSAPDLSSAGEHWDTAMHHQHGSPMDMSSHAGDLGNVTADAAGKVDLLVSRKGYKVADVLGKAIILHGAPDDLTSQPAGNSGPRIAGGIIRPE